MLKHLVLFLGIMLILPLAACERGPAPPDAATISALVERQANQALDNRRESLGGLGRLIGKADLGGILGEDNARAFDKMTGQADAVVIRNLQDLGGAMDQEGGYTTDIRYDVVVLRDGTETVIEEGATLRLRLKQGPDGWLILDQR